MEYLPRKIEEKLDKWMTRKEVIIIKGPRQAGKTTMLHRLREKFGGSYVTLEDPDELETFEKFPKSFLERHLQGKFLYIDEAQRARDAGKIAKLLYDLYSDRVKLVLTGSGSFDIKVEIGRWLVGRGVYFELLPLSYEEFVMWNAQELYKIFTQRLEALKQFLELGKQPSFDDPFRREFEDLLKEYMLYGGFPAIVKEKQTKEDLLKNLVLMYIEKDALGSFGIREIEKFRLLTKYLALSTGSIMEASSACSDVGIDFRTFNSYISILANTYIVRVISPYHTNRLNEIKKAKKLYFYDLGFRNAVLANFTQVENRTDLGAMLENFVLNELASQGYEVKYWRTTGKAEVDFVIQTALGVVPIEVKSSGMPERGFLSFIERYKPKIAVVFTKGFMGLKQIQGTKVAFFPHYFV
ncbi:hypothetical protein B9Q11_00365 [Candidatus Marsarchaeota G2 archaeon ECH_B_SAG-F08]|jgi:predicted AAA+ superfamily ATPase|uniref:AAA+ ATPase domain-containing protein n=4 Tax=Candidatus Marsarchaeota TaxID=1978152 RepID=A0A2R6BMZ4_9ARCH|nr:MAG: hypothetical protein B9Q01_02975 [Candidatus Marsarchaeota G1 archaeon OSP_D]PSN88636.1 MAG: hypothetical protein B9Q00_04615 [Candidatus Marsarchaeota G1 archaeon OSP_C]PSO00026.1 MAG: hypothetical protein B9Q11_00365 [Candidatus Marsarchaeota G2 archaeon ECH_B_SAG-F08]